MFYGFSYKLKYVFCVGIISCKFVSDVYVIRFTYPSMYHILGKYIDEILNIPHASFSL